MKKTMVSAQDVYEFQDLSENIQEKVLNNLYDINVFDDWYEAVIENWKEKLEKLGFDNSKIYFSGFWSQGDGACFDADFNISIELFDKFVGQLENKELLKPVLRHENWFFDYLYNSCEFSIEKTNSASHYNHEKTRCVTGRIAYDTTKPGYLEKCFDAFLDFLKDLRLELSQEIYEDLEKEYEYLTNSVAIVETIDCNEYQFLADGSIY